MEVNQREEEAKSLTRGDPYIEHDLVLYNSLLCWEVNLLERRAKYAGLFGYLRALRRTCPQSHPSVRREKGRREEGKKEEKRERKKEEERRGEERRGEERRGEERRGEERRGEERRRREERKEEDEES